MVHVNFQEDMLAMESATQGKTRPTVPSLRIINVGPVPFLYLEHRRHYHTNGNHEDSAEERDVHCFYDLQGKAYITRNQVGVGCY